LIQLANQIEWPRFDAAFTDCYSPDMGAPGKAIRLMVGLLYLKHMFNESDESLVARWVENPYWQYFCGYTHMQHECPVHPTALVKFRKRVGAERLAELIRETLAIAVREKHLSTHDLEQVTVDTTVQEKNITYPTDSKLLYRCIVKLAAMARQQSIPRRQSYVRVGKRASIKAGRYAHAKQFRRMNRELRRLRTYVGRLIRDIRRKMQNKDAMLESLLTKAERIRTQQRQDKNKLYSLHEPDVQCISKGKAHKRYEFGQKISVALTNRNNWFVAAELCAGNPYDGHTLAATLQAVETNTGVAVQEAYVDKGYRGHDYDGPAEIHIAGTGGKRLTRTQKRKRRSAVEPKIGHLKSDARMGRCFLKGLPGDAINATLAAAGSNLRKLLQLFYFALVRWPCVAGKYVRHVILSLANRRFTDQPATYAAA
jgi:IS5 family transposase